MSIQQVHSIIQPPQYVKELFDPVQTHGVYNVPIEDVEKIKQQLRQCNATRFRVVKLKTIVGICIICFKIKQ